MIVYGVNVCFHGLHQCIRCIGSIYVSQEKGNFHSKELTLLLSQAEKRGIKIERVNTHFLSDLTGTRKHQGIAMHLVREWNHWDIEKVYEKLDQKKGRLLLLDGVTDPHNLGACLRVADLAGVLAIIAPKDQSASLNEAAIQVSSGASFYVPYVRVTNLARTIKKLNDLGVCTMGTEAEASMSIYEVPSDYSSYAWVMGSEGKGLRRLTREVCQYLVRIPSVGHIGSLNVSVAAGICLFSQPSQV